MFGVMVEDGGGDEGCGFDVGDFVECLQCVQYFQGGGVFFCLVKYFGECDVYDWQVGVLEVLLCDLDGFVLLVDCFFEQSD